MKYLKVKMSNDKNSRSISIEELAQKVRSCYHISVESVEICDDEPQIFKKTEVGTLDIGEGMVIGNKESQCDFAHGEIVNLNNHPELRRHCKDIKTNWNFDGIKEGSLIVVKYADHSECGYVHINRDCAPYISQYSDLSQSRIYIANTAISIRIVEVPE